MTDLAQNLNLNIMSVIMLNLLLLFYFIQGRHHDHLSPANGKQELYAGAGVYVSCVELHHIHDRAGYNPADIITSMMNLFFTEEEMATSVPFRENGSKRKGKVLQQQILHAIIGKSNLLWHNLQLNLKIKIFPKNWSMEQLYSIMLIQLSLIRLGKFYFVATK